MKKVLLMMIIGGAVALTSQTANAQNDLKVEFDTYTNNQVLVGPVKTDGAGNDAINCDITITNMGDPIAVGDTIIVGYQISGTFFSIGFTPNAYSFITDEVIATGGTVQRSGGDIALVFGTETAAGTQRSICAYATLVDPNLFDLADLTYNGDDNAADNLACVTYELDGYVIDENTGFFVGLGVDLKSIANKTFIANNQLVLDNNSADFNTAAIINVISMSGQVVASENMLIERGRNTVDLNNVSTGIYLVSIQVEDEITTAKVMVK